MYYRGAEGALVCFDFTSATSFANVHYWLNELRLNAPPQLQVVLVGTKFDLLGQEVTLEQANQLAADLHLHFVHTSAKLALNVQEPFRIVAHQIVEIRPPEPRQIRQNSLHFVRNQKPKKRRKKCC